MKIPFFKARKNQIEDETKETEGRSMVEMLGVLAIIGVLSIGGLYGYSKAMERHRTNTALKDIEVMVLATRDFYRNEKDATEVNEETLYNSGRIEKKEHAFGHPIYIRVGNGPEFFSITYKSIPKRACTDILTAVWEGASKIDIAAIDVHEAVNGHFEKFPVDPVKAANACAQKDASDIVLTFYLNTERWD